MSLIDRRRSPRFPFHSNARLELGYLELEGTLMDISLSGALFASADPLEVPVEMDCRLTIGHRRRAHTEGIAGRIAHRAGRLFGIEFLDVDEAAESELRRMLDMNLAPPRLLDRDLATLLR